MAHITLITGGQRSGKSSFAQRMAEEQSAQPVYLATARIWDEDFRKRVARHQADRGEQWVTVEEQISISRHDFTGKTVLLDCITLWLTNIFMENNSDVDRSLDAAKQEWLRFVEADFELIAVSNELGMGVHPENEVARKFTDLQGWFNQFVAANAQQVFLMVSGIPVQIKK